jgi:hypothetical protein
MARANRAFLGRAVRHLVREAGVRQFLDIGTGIPTHGNTHEVAQQIASDARVVYVDNDPIVLAHARALMSSTTDGATSFIHADLHDPSATLDHPSIAETLDLTEPVAIMLVAVLMYFRDSAELQAILSTLVDAVPSGSYVTISHPTADFDPEAMSGVVAAAEGSGIPFQPRSHQETEALFTGLDLVEPGVDPVDPTSAYYWSGMARRP